jgi:hypothetical protein
VLHPLACRWMAEDNAKKSNRNPNPNLDNDANPRANAYSYEDVKSQKGALRQPAQWQGNVQSDRDRQEER